MEEETWSAGGRPAGPGPGTDVAEEVRREVVSCLFPPPGSAVRVQVHDGVVTPAGRVRDTSLVPVAARPVRAVEGWWTWTSGWTAGRVGGLVGPSGNHDHRAAEATGP